MAARRGARSAAKPARALRCPTAPRCGAAQASPRRTRCDQCDVAGRDQDAVTAIGKVEPRGSRRSRASRGCAKSLQSLQPDRAACRNRPESRAICRRCRSAGPKVFPASAAARPRQTAGCRPDWPTGSGCRRRSTAMRAGGSWRRPPVADRSGQAPEIPHRSIANMDRPASEIGRQKADSVKRSQYRKRGTAGPRPDGWLCHLCHG